MLGFEFLNNQLFGFTSKWYFVAFVITIYISYYLLEVVKQPLLVCAPCKFREFLETNLPILHEKYWPTAWCCESRAQTVIAFLLRKTLLPRIIYRREILTLKDGGEVALDWKEDNVTPSSPIILLLPGLTGCSQTDYVKLLAMNSSKMGVRLVVFNNRGLGGIPLKTARLYCATNVEDISEVVLHIKKLYPNVPLGMVGLSLGGMIGGSYLAKMPEESQRNLVAAMLISIPWNVFVGVKSLEKPIINYIINMILASWLIRGTQVGKHVLSSTTNLNEVAKSRTIREFDAKFTAKMFGYRDVVEYYNEACLDNKIHLIRVPTLCLSAADDPMQPLEGIPVKEASMSDKVAIMIPSRGGHLGFMEGLFPIKTSQYMARFFVQFFTAVFRDDNYKLISKQS